MLTEASSQEMVEDLEAEEASSVVETATLGLEEGSLEAVTEVEVDRVVDSSTATTIQGEEVVVVFSATTTIVTIRVEEGFSTTKTILDQTTQDTSVQVLHRFSSSLLHSHLAFQMKNGMETQVSNQKAVSYRDYYNCSLRKLRNLLSWSL